MYYSLRGGWLAVSLSHFNGGYLYTRKFSTDLSDCTTGCRPLNISVRVRCDSCSAASMSPNQPGPPSWSHCAWGLGARSCRKGFCLLGQGASSKLDGTTCPRAFRVGSFGKHMACFGAEHMRPSKEPCHVLGESRLPSP